MLLSVLLLISAALALGSCNQDPHTRHPRSLDHQFGAKQVLVEENADYWKQHGEDELQEALNLQPNTNIAKNIIIFIGDGMSLPTVTAARVYKNQQRALKNRTSEDSMADYDGNSDRLFWEKFPHVGLSMTYNSDYMVSDSASTAFAMYTGVKTTGYTMGYDNTIKYLDIASSVNATKVKTILDWAQEAGKKTGFVTTTRMSHATPAALYSQTPSRFWECEDEIQQSIKDGDSSQEEFDRYKPKDITLQLIENENAQKIDIMMGGGRASFLPKSESDPEARWDYDTYDWSHCNRLDGRNLIQEWVNNTGGRYVENLEQLNKLTLEEEKVLGIFSESYCYWDHEVNETNNIPRLKDMALRTVEFLEKKSDDNGYFVMIEAGRIDAAHHNGEAVTALSETVAFEAAIEAVMKIINTEETLVLVTADHAHTMSIGGYTSRFHDITGVVDDHNDFNDLAEDGNTFSILSYGNGPGFMDMNATGAGNYTMINRGAMDSNSNADYDHHQPTAQPLKSETHGGDDVGIWATGPMSHLVHGVHQQSYIAQVMSYSACIGPHDTPQCRNNRQTLTRDSGSGSLIVSTGTLLGVLLLSMINI